MGRNTDWIRKRQRRVAARQRKYQLRRERQRRLASMQYAMLLCLAATVSAAVSINAVEVRPAFGTEVDGVSGCRTSMSWPLSVDSSVPTVVKPFKSPPQPWLAGHRGVDLQVDADQPTIIYAPMDGVVSFAGTVAGKNVVSVRHATRTSTFEPAQTDLAVGAAVNRGDAMARVEGRSDHCDAICLHWGVKTEAGSYIDPASAALPHRIVLKPVQRLYGR